MDSIASETGADEKGRLSGSGSRRPWLARRDRPRTLQKIGWPGSEPLRIENAGDPLAFRAPVRNWVELLREALENRKELASAGARSLYAELGLTAVRRERYPWISFVQFLHQSSRTDSPARWAFQVEVELPLFRLRSPEAQAAAAELRQAQFRNLAVRAGIAAEVDEVLLRLGALERELDEHASEMKRLAERHMQIAQAQLASGESDRVEPLLANVLLLSVNQIYLAKLMEYQALEVGLDQAVGRISG